MTTRSQPTLITPSHTHRTDQAASVSRPQVRAIIYLLGIIFTGLTRLQGPHDPRSELLFTFYKSSSPGLTRLQASHDPQVRTIIYLLGIILICLQASHDPQVRAIVYLLGILLTGLTRLQASHDPWSELLLIC